MEGLPVKGFDASNEQRQWHKEPVEELLLDPLHELDLSRMMQIGTQQDEASISHLMDILWANVELGQPQKCQTLV